MQFNSPKEDKASRAAYLAGLADTDPSKLAKELVLDFIALYGGSPSDVSVFASPARINIIGEHIDYNGGKVFPAAIDKYLYLLIRKRADSKVVYNDLRFPGAYAFDVNETFSYKKENDYANYLNGILQIMREGGHRVGTGFEILMFSTIPAGGGVSSSAALEVGFAWAISELYGLGLDRVAIAKMGQRSEHEFMNVKCGIMDQFIIAVGKKDNAIELDCDTLDYRYVPLALGDYRIVVMNTNKKRQLADSKYNERRGECMTALAILQARADIKNLCDLSVSGFDSCADSIADPVIRKRAKHCVYENDRVKKAVAALEKGDLVLLGKLLCESHVSLRDDYEVTGAELDALYEESIRQPGCLGARMTGAGFGGCAIAIVHKDSVAAFTERVKAAYAKRTGLEAGFFACKPGDGVFKM
jgi:galactokinase